jgi:carbon-monoxide dehydrogenase large subunit
MAGLSLLRRRPRVLLWGSVCATTSSGEATRLHHICPHDLSGQLLTTTLMDYPLPTADRVPAVEVVIHEAPAPSNPLGVKGAGETGTSGVGAAIANAVAAAVGPAAARHLPVTAPRITAALG